MDFRLDEDQIAIRDGVRAFCEQRLALESVSELEGPIDRSLWRELAELGVFRLRLPEADGGLGLGMVEAVVVFAELGKSLAPTTAMWSHLSAPWVDGAGDGEVVVGGIDCAEPGGEPPLVASLDSLDVLVVVRDEGVEVVRAAEVEAESAVVGFDPLTPLSAVRSLPAGKTVGGADLTRAFRREGAVLAAAQLLGMSEATLTLANDYAKGREQFGRPIGGFQAIKHMLADMYCRQEVARAAVYAAGATLDTPDVGDVDYARSAAKLTCGEASMRNARACIQVHGGMGYTWEVPAHYYLKRTWTLESCFGTAAVHAETLAEAMADSVSPRVE